jgi:hypothetical protein
MKLTSLNYLQLTGTLPSQLAELTGLTDLGFDGNQLTGTIPPQLVALAVLTGLALANNHLTGAVSSLPFKQYTSNCYLYNFPLPTGAADCIAVLNGHPQPGVACMAPPAPAPAIHP